MEKENRSWGEKKPAGSIVTPEEACVAVAKAYAEGKADPNDPSAPPYVRQLARFCKPSEITEEKVEAAMKSGGTNHPDPTLRTVGR